MQVRLRKNLSRLSLFSSSTLTMAFSMLSVIVLLIWWQRLISRNLENQYGFFKSQITEGIIPSIGLRHYIRDQDEKLATLIFRDKTTNAIHPDAIRFIDERLNNRQKMVLYEQAFFIILLLSGHIFFLYIYFRERLRRAKIEETILLATHELRQPLQSLSLALETIAPKAQGKSLSVIETGLSEIQKLSELIRWLAKTFVGKNTGQEEVIIKNFNSYLLTFIKQDFDKKQRKRIHCAIPAMLTLRLKLSESLFHFVLRNLIENALKYAVGPIHISAAITGKHLVLTIINTGTAISTLEFKKIGRIFFRSADNAIQNTTGFGLGLYLSGRIARNAKGRLIIEHDASGRTAAILMLRYR